MRSGLRFPWLPGAALALVWISLFAQDKQTVWTKVIGTGNSIVVNWDKKHPWDAILAARGAELVAEYRQQNGEIVSEIVSRASATPQDRSYRFALPDVLKGAPEGEVCLYVHPSGERALLPVRAPTSDTSDTARFRYDSWSKSVVSASAARLVRLRLETEKRNLAVFVEQLGSQRKLVLDRGWSTNEKCDAITTGAAQPMIKPYDVVAPAEQDAVARRVCIYRSWKSMEYRDLILAKVREAVKKNDREKAAGLFRAIYSIGLVPLATGPLLGELKGAAGADNQLAVREQQATIFDSDWMKWAASSKDYDPQIKDFENAIELPSAATESAFRVFGLLDARSLGAEWLMQNASPPDRADIEGTVGSALDAYFGCLEDGKKQLGIKYRSWQDLVSSAPKQAAAEKEFLVNECHRGLSKLDQLTAEVATLRENIARDEQALATATSGVPPPKGTETLNLLSCSLRAR